VLHGTCGTERAGDNTFQRGGKFSRVSLGSVWPLAVGLPLASGSLPGSTPFSFNCKQRHSRPSAPVAHQQDAHRGICGRRRRRASPNRRQHPCPPDASSQLEVHWCNSEVASKEGGQALQRPEGKQSGMQNAAALTAKRTEPTTCMPADQHYAFHCCKGLHSQRESKTWHQTQQRAKDRYLDTKAHVMKP
jgi:hypothetical protein